MACCKESNRFGGGGGQVKEEEEGETRTWGKDQITEAQIKRRPYPKAKRKTYWKILVANIMMS